MDLHCTVTKLMTEVADAVSIYRTYPHVDGFECGQEVGVILFGMLYGTIKPVMAVSKPPLMIGPPLNVVTSDMPMKLIYDRAREMQRTIPGVLTVCPAHGFMQQDCPDQGVGVLATVDRDRMLAQKLADEIGDMLFKYRKEFWIHLPDAAEVLPVGATHHATSIATRETLLAAPPTGSPRRSPARRSTDSTARRSR